MPKFIVTKTFQYIEEVEVEAEIAKAAKEAAADIGGTRIYHYTLIENVARRIAE
jgi:hypothetical protein